jgi:hypothetical protein
VISKRTRTWIGAGVALALVATSGLVAGEVVARGQLDARAASFSGSLPGVSAEVGGGPALWQLASGAVEVRLTVADAALDALARCRTDQEVTVHAVSGGVVVETERTLRGVPVTVDVLLVPQRDAAGWRLVADSVSAAGISLPAERALKVLSGRDGDGAGFAQRLADGIPLVLPGAPVRGVEFRAGAAVLSVGLPVARDGAAEGGSDRWGSLRECLDPSASTDPADPAEPSAPADPSAPIDPSAPAAPSIPSDQDG